VSVLFQDERTEGARRSRSTRVIVDIGRLSELRRLEATASGPRIGALVTHRTIEVGDHPSLAGYELLSRAARDGHYPIRTRGTFRGSIAHADPTAE